MAGRVKQEFLHAWRNYEQYAWGHDALRPLSKTPHDWYGESLLMTPVDALDTLILMGLNDEANRDRELITTHLSFDKDIYASGVTQKRPMRVTSKPANENSRQGR